MATSIRSFSITAQSALVTASFCYRRSVRDTWKIWNLVTCDRAIELYQVIWRAIQLACWIVFTLGQIARRECDHLVEWAQEQPSAPQTAPVPVSSVSQVEEVRLVYRSCKVPLSSPLACVVPLEGHSLSNLKKLARAYSIPRYSRLTREEILAIFS